jgi:hypothetical protein
MALQNGSAAEGGPDGESTQDGYSTVYSYVETLLRRPPLPTSAQMDATLAVMHRPEIRPKSTTAHRCNAHDNWLVLKRRLTILLNSSACCGVWAT